MAQILKRVQAGAQQRLRDEAAFPEGSPQRYDDITADDDG